MANGSLWQRRRKPYAPPAAASRGRTTEGHPRRAGAAFRTTAQRVLRLVDAVGLEAEIKIRRAA